MSNKSSFNENQILESLQNSSPFSDYGSNIETGSNFVSFFQNISWQTWILIVIIFAILGFNIFVYLAKGTQWFANLVNGITNWFSSLFGNSLSNTAKQTVNVSATGAKAGIDVAAGATTGAIDYASQPTTVQGNPAYTSQPGQPIQNQNQEQMQEDALDKALDHSSNYNVQADDSYSSIQGAGKSGWCLIGEDQGIRSCMQVGPNDQCMSGDIFPTNAVCVNPNLRV
jgi:hypothetical protein